MKITIDTNTLNDYINFLTEMKNASFLNAQAISTIGGIKMFLREIVYGMDREQCTEIVPYVAPEVPNGRMTIRELMGYEIDVDVANNVTDSLGICLCCPMQLTEEGEREWGDVMKYVVNVYGEDNYATCIVDDDPNTPWNIKAKRLDQFLWAAAGYCSEEDYDKWFTEPSDE